MPNEHSLLHAILAEPDEDEPRLAYAEWCDLRNDPRGRFIRHQLQFARSAAQDPNDPDLVRLDIEIRELEGKYGQSWTAPLKGLVQRSRFHRGFVEGVTLTVRTFLEKAPELFELAPVRHLDLVDVGDYSERLFASPHLARLRSLRLDRCQLGDQDVARLAASRHVGHLRWLSLAYNAIGFDGADALAGSANLGLLTYVDFEGNLVDPTPRFIDDQGIILESDLPESGQRLEERHGPIQWLRQRPKTTAEVVPNRYLM